MKTIIIAICLVTIGVYSYGQAAMVVGYLPTYRFSSSSQIEYCKLTHLNLSFANPDSEGNLLIESINSVMSDALSSNPSICISISLGGGALTEQQKSNWSNLIDIPANRPAYISKIVDFVLENSLDGVDMDLEWGDVTSGYSDFIIELDTALSSHNKLLTVALPNQTLFSNITREALNAFDLINIMSYDATGPWKPSSPGQHSSFTFSTNGINFWKNTIGVPGSKLTLGVPFYGYDFVDLSTVNSATYSQIVADNPENADLDNVGNIYYNGRPTIESKVNLAKNEVAGIMIWEIGQDSFDEYSLLSTIHNKFTSLGITTTGLCGNENAISSIEPESHNNCRIYPNPSSAYFTINFKGFKAPTIKMSNTLGEIVTIRTAAVDEDELFFDTSRLQKGIYFILIIDKENVPQTHKIIVI